MYKHILIPTDGSPLSEDAVKQGLALAKTLNAKVTAVTVTPPFHVFAADPAMVTDTREQYEKDAAAMGHRRLRFARDAASVAVVACDVVHTVAEHPYAAIIDAATARGCDLIVMASHGRKGFTGLVLGSETLKVLTHSKIPTLVTR